jgi:hypothetical protein
MKHYIIIPTLLFLLIICCTKKEENFKITTGRFCLWSLDYDSVVYCTDSSYLTVYSFKTYKRDSIRIKKVPVAKCNIDSIFRVTYAISLSKPDSIVEWIEALDCVGTRIQVESLQTGKIHFFDSDVWCWQKNRYKFWNYQVLYRLMLKTAFND